MLLLLEKIRLDSRLVILFTFLVLISVFVFTDNLYSSFHLRAFNPTESILRSIFWCLFIPIFYVLEYKKAYSAHLKIVVAVLIHLVVLVVILIGLFTFSGYTATFFESVRHWITQYSFIPLITYVLYFGLVTRLERSNPPSSSRSSKMNSDTDRLLVKNGSKRVAITLKEINYISTAKPYIKIVVGEQSWLYSSSLSAFLSEYGKDYFVRVHKSVIVNANMITAVCSRKNGDFDLTLRNGDVVRASRNYRDQFQHLL